MSAHYSTLRPDPETAWDCDPSFQPILEDYDLDLDETDSESDWQVICLDRFGDRLVNGELN